MHIPDAQSLQQLSAELQTYDVAQNGWEQEPNGFEANAKHVLLHLAKNQITKNFTNPAVVRSEVAPDATMHAMRLARWNDQPVGDIIPSEEHQTRLYAMAGNFGGLALDQVGFITAASTLAGFLHGYDHAAERQRVIDTQPQLVRSVGGLLLYTASLQAQMHKFSLTDAFRNRLTTLRRVRGIPEPGQS